MLIYSTCIYQHHFHKKKTACYSNQEINMQTELFFFQFSSLEKKQHVYTNIILTKKAACYSNQEINMQIRFFFFFSRFPAQKNNMHIPTSFSQKKTTCYFNQEINMQTGFFFQFFSSEKQHTHSPGSSCSNPTIQVSSTCSRTANSRTKIQLENMS